MQIFVKMEKFFPLANYRALPNTLSFADIRAPGNTAI